MPTTIWNGPGMPGMVAPKFPIAQMRQRRNLYKLVRRSTDWVVRAKYLSSWPDNEWLENTGAFMIKTPTPPNTWEWTYLKDVRDWDYDFWFRTRGEAIMFMMRCE